MGRQVVRPRPAADRQYLVHSGRGVGSAADRYTPEVRLTPAEVQRLVTCTRGSGRPGCHRYHALLVLLAHLGLRITEALQVRLADLDPERNTIRLQTLKQRRRKKARAVVQVRMVHPKVIRALLAWARRARLKPTDRLFSMARQTAWESFIRYRDLAGLPKGVSLHSLRHFRGDQDYQATRDPRWVAYRLRHAGLAHVTRYAQVGQAQEAELVQKIGAIT